MFRNKCVFQAVLILILVLAAHRGQAQAAPSFRISPVSFTGSLSDYSSSNATAEPAAAQMPRAPYKVAPSVNSERSRPFSSVQVGLKVSTLGAGVDLSTPLSRHFALRGQFNLTSFDYLFNIDGVDYDSRFNLRSGSAGIDWYPTRHSLRISPGVLYFNNHLKALSGVAPGNYFELGDTGFINSVDDPLNGDAEVVFHRHVVPMMVIGFNLIGGRQSRFSMPIEIGGAYTGTARINVTLNGTACTYEGCFTFADNQEAQQSMQQEIEKLNNRLSSYPVYPIVSIGFAYRFGSRR
jgi:hypothetical protein